MNTITAAKSAADLLYNSVATRYFDVDDFFFGESLLSAKREWSDKVEMNVVMEFFYCLDKPLQSEVISEACFDSPVEFVEKPWPFISKYLFSNTRMAEEVSDIIKERVKADAIGAQIDRAVDEARERYV